MANEKRLIDANAFEEYHCNDCPYRQEGSCTNDDPICATINDLREAPTVDAVEVVHGHWEDAYEIKSFRHTNIPVVKCSKCECYFCDIINNHHWFYHYCPNCGANMMDGERREGE